MLHFLQYNFAPSGQQFYAGAAWPNVVAMVPCGIVLWLWLRSKHVAVSEAHEALKAAHLEHAEKLDQLLKSVDPDAEGKISDVLDRLDPSTPSGIGVIASKLDELAPPKP